MLTVGGTLRDLFLGPCVSYSHLPDFWTGCVQASLKHGSSGCPPSCPCARASWHHSAAVSPGCFHVEEVPPSKLGKEVRRKYLSSWPELCSPPLFGQCKAVCVGFPYGFVIGMAFPSASIVAAIGALNLVTAAPIGPQQQRCPQ